MECQFEEKFRALHHSMNSKQSVSAAELVLHFAQQMSPRAAEQAQASPLEPVSPLGGGSFLPPTAA